MVHIETFLFVLTFTVTINICRTNEPDSMTLIIRQLISTEQAIWSNILNPRWLEVRDSESPGPDVGIAKSFHNFSESLNKLKFYDNWYKDTPIDRWWVWSMMAPERREIYNMFEKFKIFMRHQANERITSPPEAWLELAESALNKTNSIPDMVEKIHQFVIHSQLFKHALKESETFVCEFQQSPNQLLYNMYETILYTEMKGHAITQYSWMVLKLFGKGNFTFEADSTRSKYEERTKLTILTAKNTIAEASRVIWRCDPSVHIEGTTYVQITRLLQGYIENEVDMNSKGSCGENCGFYKLTKNYGCFKDKFCSRQPICSGNILNCRYVDSDMEICLAPSRSSRRYEWIKYENGKLYGDNRLDKCYARSVQVKSWWKVSLYHCSYCMCLCDERSDLSDRYINMREITSTIQKNKVITGLRFVKQKRVIHIQINEGTLLPGGIIDLQSLEWQSINEIDIRRAVKNVDYHELSYEERGIDLDDLTGSPGYVLTGVRFRKLGAHLNFEIQLTPFNFTTGNLLLSKSMWIGNDNTVLSQKPRKQVQLYEPDVPIKSNYSPIKSSHNQFVEFTHSDFAKDAAQTTVPFLDAQPVISTHPIPLSGAGIYHKASDSSGGFIGFKVFTYDYSQHMDDTIVDLNTDINNINWMDNVEISSL